ncbi:hypothetical protein JW887_04805 [Candidatus Dojkabacteria bacterium]|nr:hypothetical protein [Candidatus Dojkabacteria bacterium]
MTDKKKTLGQAIDQIIDALNSLEQNAQKTAIEAACSHLGIQPSSSHDDLLTPKSSPLATLISHEGPMVIPTQKIDIRTLKEQKQPKSAQQMACVVAYFLQELAPEAERKDIITASDLEKYFKQAKFKLPKTIQQVLPDGRAAGYFESAPGRGEYKLNAVGYNLVAHNLPKQRAD